MNASINIRPRSAWRALGLTVSVILNLFLAALVGGHFLRAHLHRISAPTENAPLARQLERIEAALPPQDAIAFRTVMERDKPQFSKAAQQLVAARRALRRQVAADPFDPQAASAAISAYRASWSRFVDDFSGPLIDALSQVSAKGRRDLVAAQRKARERFLSGKSRR